MILDNFSRYKPIIDDWDAFAAAVQRPLPTTIWANPLKIKPAALARLLAEQGCELQPLPWQPAAFYAPEDFAPGLRWEYLAGLYHVQEEVSMLPITLLDLQPTDRVLDLCAAPGNKTAQMGVLMQNRGTIVANDRSKGRMRATRQVLNRLGITNVTALTRDAASLPRKIGQFDKILADVPCTCEGTCRKDGDAFRRHPAENKKMARVQKAILRKAVQLCRPGGRIVYATCTFAPEENELVVEAVLRQYEGRIRLVPAAIPGFTLSAGITEWQGQPLDPSLSLALRAWPHQNDTGGFFMAVLEKVKADDVEAALPKPVTAVYEAILEAEPWVETAVTRFGFPPDLFDDYALLRWGRRGVWLVNKDHLPPAVPQPDSVGMMFTRTSGKYPKITTGTSLLFGAQAAQNFVSLTAAQAKAFYTRQTFAVTAEQRTHCTSSGYVLLRYRQVTIGVGVYRANAGTVESMFPKGWMRLNVIV